MLCTTSTPPAGSESLARGATSVDPPAGRTPRSSSATGTAWESTGTTSTLMTPRVVAGPSETV